MIKSNSEKIREHLSKCRTDRMMAFGLSLWAYELQKERQERKEQILQFLRELKASDEKIIKIYMYGSCFRLYKILKVLYPQAQALYSHSDGHWITKIDNYYYDINGKISEKYVEEKGYTVEPESEASAYIPTYSNAIGTHYNKYDEL